MGGILLFPILGCRFFSDFDVGGCIFQENVPIETFSTSFESTPTRNGMVIRNVFDLFQVLTSFI